MNQTGIQEVLDGLDRRLALGEIDLGTYQSLKAKFSAQASQDNSGTPIAAAIAALPIEAVAIKCPGCLAPLPVLPDSATGSITCEFCQGSFSIQTATDEMERLRGDVRKWISETVGRSGSSGGDETSRAFIFRNNIWPPLQLNANRTLELYQPTRFLPFFSFPLLNQIDRSPFHDALALTPNLDHLVDRLKGVVAQIQAPELMPFAATEYERKDLHLLETSCLELVHLSNVRHSLASYTPEGFKCMSANLRALEDMYTTAGSRVEAHDPTLARFFLALQNRLKGVGAAAEVIEILWKESDGVVIDPLIAKLDQAADACLAAASEMEVTGREPKDTVPAAEGARNDAQVIRMLADCMRIFAESGAAEAGTQFTEFETVLEQMIEVAAPSNPDIHWLNGFLANVARHLGALDGSIQVPIVDDFSWVDPIATAGINNSFFAGKETFDIEDRHLVPFWLAAIHFSEQSGSWFWKKGQSVAGLLFMDASRHGGQCFIEPGDSTLANMTQAALDAPRGLGSAIPAFTPITSSDSALRGMKSSIASDPKYRGSHFRIIGLVYLPVATVKYTNKKGNRLDILLPGTNRKSISLDTQNFRIGDRETLLVG